ncbi:uncharacterized protein LOC120352072 isoform X1 [Nilaparvata lugens]|nr:uncharacterized protein LOC120352072 isoform X1 [Nilaparvata lugens]
METDSGTRTRPPSAGTADSIKQSSLGRVLCDNGDNITEITDNVFLLPTSQQRSALKSCSEIPSPDCDSGMIVLTATMKWKTCDRDAICRWTTRQRSAWRDLKPSYRSCNAASKRCDAASSSCHCITVMTATECSDRTTKTGSG